ncbi:BrnT family toxin [Hydrogenivirga sp. 128-5-R1-1]|uniref:BrnT family toxin n=1 Tax=Hydrogenivirga sp. 128-5-R1-1 TaxID=392423 RepID=UPI00015F39E1|nr:BrnT family toxin [Hydrogenivirga sp. 128-5-R1-1]EDP75089.1 hypothetical protein HG1285_14514 [Hydrogenivirga sp. 128-5-R1-1]
MGIDWDEDKNFKLKLERGIGFEDVVIAINEGKILDILEHPNRDRYPSQKLLIVEIGGYAYVVPFEEREGVIRFITIFPSRKMTKQYLGGDRNGET